MTRSQRLMALLNIRPGEGTLVALVLAYAFLLYASNVLVNTASYALFVDRFGADRHLHGGAHAAQPAGAGVGGFGRQQRAVLVPPAGHRS